MKAFFTLLGTGRLVALLICAVLGGLAVFLKFCIPGYSFSALVCLCLIGILLFYTFMPLVGITFPAFARIATKLFTTVLVIGLLIVGVTEAIIIKASFGSPKEPVQYMVVLGAKVNKDGPSVSLWDRICGAYTYLDEHPDVIAIGGIYQKKRLAELYATEPWNQLRAVQNNDVYNIPVGFVGFEQTCSTSALFIYSQANQLYPELFDYDMVALAKDYMQRYFGYTLTDEAAENMINGYFKDGSTMIE